MDNGQVILWEKSTNIQKTPPKTPNKIIKKTLSKVVKIKKSSSVKTTAQYYPIIKANIEHRNFPKGSIKQEYVKYAYKIGGFAFVKLLECENGNRDITKKANGSEKSYGFCQLNMRWKSEIINDWRFAIDANRQIDQCYKFRKEGTPFYGPDRPINGIQCRFAVNDRFDFYD